MNTKIVAAMLTLIFIGTAVAVQPGTPEETVLNGVLDNSGSEGQDQLQATWETRDEFHKLYLRTADEARYFPCSGGSSDPNRCREHSALLYSSLDVGGVVSGPKVFSYGQTVLDTPLHQLDANLYISSQGISNELIGTEIFVKLLADGSPIPGAVASFDTTDLGNLPSLVDPTGFTNLGYSTASSYEVSRVFETPIVIPGGVALSIEISAEGGPQSGSVHLSYDRDSHALGLIGIGTDQKSWVRLRASSAHVQTWTETRQGAEQDVFPLPLNAPTNDRTVRFAVAQVSGLGDRAIREQLHTVELRGADSDTLYFARGGENDGVTPWGYPTHSPSDVTPTNDGIFFAYYDLTYPTGLAEIGEFDFKIFNTPGGWDFEKTINVGGGSFGIELLQTESASKTVFMENPSTFIFEVTNLGSVIDDAVISFEQSNQAWDVSLSPGTLLQKMAPGAVREVVVGVTPPPGVVAGERLFLNITAQSIISTQAAQVSFEVIITDVAEYGLSIIGEIRDIKISPSETRVVPVTIRNDGNTVDQFVVSGSGAPAGWRMIVSPSVLDIPAQSQLPVFVTLTAPANAERGEEFDLRVTARRSNDFDVSASRVIPVDVFKQDLFEFKLEDESVGGKMTYIEATSEGSPFVRSLRDEGPDAAATDSYWDGLEGPDREFDPTAVFKLIFANPGDTDDVISFTPEWGTGYQDVAGNAPCDGAGHPDGWRVRLWQDGTTPGAFQNVNDGQFRALGFDVPVPKGEERAVFLEAKWQPTDSNCPSRVQSSDTGTRGYDPAPFAPVEVEAFSQNNPVNRFVHHVRATIDLGGAGARESENMYANANRDISIQHGGPGLDRVASALVSVDGTAAQRIAKIPIAISNTGNEMDSIRVSLPSTSRGWSFTIVDVETANAFDNDISFAHSTGGRTAGCTDPETEDGFLVMECTMGVGDQVKFNLRASAGNTVEIGDALDFKVEAISLDSLQDGLAGTIRDNLDISLKAAGTFVMDLLPNPSIGRVEYEVQPGEKLVIPLSLENAGTNDDEYAWAFTSTPQNEDWVGTLSHGGFLGVPAGQVLHGFATIFVPADAAIGSRVGYTVGAQGTDSTDSLNIQLEVIEGNGFLNVDTIPTDVVVAFDDRQPVEFNITRLAGAAENVNVRVIGSLPGEVAVQNLDKNIAFDSEGNALGGLDLVTTSGHGNSRIPVTIEATDSDMNKARGTFIVNFASANLGFTATAPETAISILPGGSASVNIDLRNLGLGNDLILASVASQPANWAANFDEDVLPLNPLGTTTAKLVVFAGAEAVRGTTGYVSVVFTSNSDPLVSTRVDVPFLVGVSELNVTVVADMLFVAPTEPIQYKVSVANIGDIADSVRFSAIVPETLRSLASASISSNAASLTPGEAEEFTLTVTLSGGLAGGTKVPITVKANSTNPMLQGSDSAVVQVEMLAHRSADVDRDGYLEYAVDRNRIVNDGFESYLDLEPVGIVTNAPNMERFLTDEAKAAKTVEEVIENETVTRVVFNIDGDNDGRVDLFIDSNNDLVPDIFWAPSRGHFHEWDLSKDVTGDGIPEAFIDVDANGVLDVMYDFPNGEFTTLLKLDVDGDGHMDYVIDQNGNGIADKGETVLFGNDGKITAILEYRDINGDGAADAVYDTDGDGRPNYFVVEGTDRGIDIILRDVTGDGVLDWTFDADGDGKVDSYYDPVTGQSGLIDTTEDFGRLVKEYWYVGALFGLVAILFVVLVVMTRRS